MRRWLSIAALALVFSATSASPAEAAPVFAAIGAIASTISTFVAGLGAIGSLVLRLVVSAAASALLRALQPKPREPGIKTEVTQSGGTNPCSFILLKYATGGVRLCPPMSHGSTGNTPNAYLTEVIELGDVPGQALSRVMIEGEYVTLGTTPHADYGLPVLGRFSAYAWVKYYDGTQTTADPMLLAKYGSYPERPWSADMIGRGLCYAIVTFRYNRKLWGSSVPPRLRFEMGGIPLYDPRKDSTVGGAGAHRWANKATWEATANPMVGVYNIMRGIALDDGSTWGGTIPAADLPLAAWFAAMNECDVAVGDGGAGTEPQYRAGFEVTVDEEPADIIAELLKACSGQLAEIGGIWKPRAGSVGLPVFNFADGDMVITKENTLAPFPGFTSSFNGIHATYPEPAEIWEQKEAPPLYNATWEAEDQGQRLIANLGLPSVPYGAQVRRIMAAYIKDERRFRRHGLTLPPDAAVLEPLDVVAWTSPANLYTAKVFEVSEVVEDPHTCLVQLALRERDPADYVSANPAPPPVVSVLPVIPPDQTVPGFAVSGTSILDAASVARRPALELTWTTDLPDVTGIMWEVRLQATGIIVASGSTQNVAAGSLLVAEGMIAATAYEVRALPVVDRPSAWTAWLPATTPATLITRPDLADGSVSDQLQTIVLGPFTHADLPNGTVVATLDMGAIGAGEGWVRRMHFEAQGTSAGTTISFAFILDVERRKAVLGGGFSSWVSVDNFEIYGAGLDVFASSGNIAGTYDDFEYRLKVTQRPPVSGTTVILQNVYMTVTKVTK